MRIKLFTLLLLISFAYSTSAQNARDILDKASDTYNKPEQSQPGSH